MHRFEGKVVVVTGAGSGIGRASAIRLAQEGAAVTLTVRNLDAGARVAEEIVAAGGRALVLAVDVTRPDDVATIVPRTLEAFGRLDGAVNNAGVSPEATLLADYDDDLWNSVLDVNLHGMYLCMKEELRHFRSQGGGAIVNVASYTATTVQIPGVSAYATAKHATAGLTRAAARDYAPAGIRVNALCPGHTRTPMVTARLDDEVEAVIRKRIPMGRIAEPEEMSGAVAFLLSEDASFITGHLLVVDGGLSI